LAKVEWGTMIRCLWHISEVEYNGVVEMVDEDQWRLETSWGGKAERGGSESRCGDNEVTCILKIRRTI